MHISGSDRIGFTSSAFFLAAFSLFSPVVAFGSGGGITVIPDGSLFIQIANFLFLIWALNILLYRPIRNILLKRKDRFSSLEQNIESLSKDAQEKDEAFDAGIKTARTQGFERKESLLQAAAAEEKKIIDEIHQKAQANLAEVRQKIATDTETVRAALQKEVEVFAKAIGEKILGRAV